MPATPSPIPHHAFYAALAAAAPESAAWRATAAGLVALRLADDAADDPTLATAADVAAVAGAIERVDAGDPARHALAAVLDALEPGGAALGRALAGYGRALDFTGAWALAEAAYAAAAAHAHPALHAELAVEVEMRRAYCARMCGRHDAAAAAYARAGRVAQDAGDAASVLHAEVGRAKLALERGNLPEAERVLDAAIRRARAGGHGDVHAVALHDRAHVAHLRGDDERAARYAWDALGRTRASAERDRVLADLAAFFGELGVRDVARDAFLVVAATAQEQYVRWTAAINLLEIASLDGRRDAFDAYRRELEAAALPPIHRAQFLLHLGESLARFDEAEAAARALDETAAVADAHAFHQLAFAARAARAALRSGRPSAPGAAPRPEPATLADVAAGVRALRAAAAA